MPEANASTEETHAHPGQRGRLAARNLPQPAAGWAAALMACASLSLRTGSLLKSGSGGRGFPGCTNQLWESRNLQYLVRNLGRAAVTAPRDLRSVLHIRRKRRSPERIAGNAAATAALRRAALGCHLLSLELRRYRAHGAFRPGDAGGYFVPRLPGEYRALQPDQGGFLLRFASHL